MHAELEPEKFWRLTWYDFTLCTERFYYNEKIRNRDWEERWVRFRIQWADFRNANRGKKQKAFRPQDLIKLPIDDVTPEYRFIDMDAIKKKLGSKINKKGGRK